MLSWRISSLGLFCRAVSGPEAGSRLGRVREERLLRCLRLGDDSQVDRSKEWNSSIGLCSVQ